MTKLRRVHALFLPWIYRPSLRYTLVSISRTLYLLLYLLYNTLLRPVTNAHTSSEQ